MPNGKKILIVEDDLSLLRLYTLALSKRDYWVDSAVDGEEALQKLKSDEKYDLVLLDILLPKFNGLEILKKIKEVKSPSKDIPVYVLTNVENDQSIQEAIALGARGYFLKVNTTPDKMVDEVDHLFVTANA